MHSCVMLVEQWIHHCVSRSLSFNASPFLSLPLSLFVPFTHTHTHTYTHTARHRYPHVRTHTQPQPQPHTHTHTHTHTQLLRPGLEASFSPPLFLFVFLSPSSYF